MWRTKRQILWTMEKVWQGLRLKTSLDCSGHIYFYWYMCPSSVSSPRFKWNCGGRDSTFYYYVYQVESCRFLTRFLVQKNDLWGCVMENREVLRKIEVMVLLGGLCRIIGRETWEMKVPVKRERERELPHKQN